jgi:diguanylate cyclase (GGDEF)-like protein
MIHDPNNLRNGFTAEAERARRYEAHLSVLLLNLDGLGLVNDRLGREAGDQVLREVGDLIRQHTRSIDVVGRWDREDYIVLSVDKNAFGSVVMAEKLRRIVADHTFDWQGKSVRVTISIGVSRGVPGDETAIDGLIESARSAVLRAKAAGRNRIEYAGGSGEMAKPV